MTKQDVKMWFKMKSNNDDNDLLWSIIIIILNIITICNEIWFKYKFVQFKGLVKGRQYK